MRLLFVTGSLVHGGAERHTITLINRLAERGHECHLAYVKDDTSQLERVRGAAGTRCLQAGKYLDRNALEQLTGLIRETNPSVVIAVNAYALLYARLALRRARVAAPLVVTWHTTRLRNAKEWLQMLYYRPLFWSAERLVFVCEAQRRYWVKRLLSGRANEVIYNGVDTDAFHFNATERTAVRRLLGYAERDFVVGMSAVLRAEKNPVELVRALAQVRAWGIPAKALFIGDGPLRGAVEAAAARLGVGAEVTITGLQQDVRPLLAACDAVALCSTAVETFSLAALEALALGRPVVHSAVGGAAEMIRPGSNGYLFPVGDDAALADRLALLADPERRARMGTAAQASAASRFSERSMIDRYESLFLELELARSKRENLRRPAGAH
jgi:glycosyltransferase involved in cell wall biosynthesis